VHREVYGEAAVYFDPYSEPSTEAALRAALAPEHETLRSQLRGSGAEVSARYRPERVLPQWREFLRTL
jgi:hypothetical protein